MVPASRQPYLTWSMCTSVQTVTSTYSYASSLHTINFSLNKDISFSIASYEAGKANIAILDGHALLG